MRILYSLLMLVCVCTLNAADLVSTNPSFLTENTQDARIYFNPQEGNKGLAGSQDIYAHVGVITNKSDGEWVYGPDWGDNSAKYKLSYKNDTKSILYLGGEGEKGEGTIREFFGITDEDEHILQIALVFRNSACTKEGKTADGGDIFVTVYEDGLSASLTSSAGTNVLSDDNCSVTFTVNASAKSTISLYKNEVASANLLTSNSGKPATKLTYDYTVPQGNVDIIAVVTDGANTVQDTLSLCHRRASEEKSYPGTLKPGTTVNADGSVTFCLIAPNKDCVMLVGEWNDYKPVNEQVMDHQGDYFWITVNGLDMDTEYAYYYLVDDTIGVGDPYAHLILDPYNDKYISSEIYPDLHPFPTKIGKICCGVFHGNGDKYNWEVTDFKAPAKEDLVIYEVLVRDFTDADDSKDRSIKSLIEKLDYIQGLGVNAIELMPIQEFDGNISWGYNPNFYFAPDKAYGTVSDYKRLVDECHKRGMAVVLDVVFNHAYGLHPWCLMYWENSAPSSSNPFFNKTAPHNYSVGNDWKQENEYVRAHFCDMLKYWAKDYKIDGFRFDLAKGYGDSDSYSGDYEGSKYNASRIANNKRFVDAIKSVNENGYAIFEYFVASAEEEEMGAYGAMSWKQGMEPTYQTAGGYTSSSSMSTFFDAKHYYVTFPESHDEQRNAYWMTQYAQAGIKGNTAMTMRRLGMAASLAFTQPGAKMFWQFGEMGYDEPLTDDGRTDEKPTHWEYLNDADRNGLVKSYSEIINIRTKNPELFKDATTTFTSVTAADWTNGRFVTAKANGKELIVCANPNTIEKTFSYSFSNPSGKYYINSKSYNTDPSFDAVNGKITVPAGGYVIISNMEGAGVDAVVDDTVADYVAYADGRTICFTAKEGSNVTIARIDGTYFTVKATNGLNKVDVESAGVYFVNHSKVLVK